MARKKDNVTFLPVVTRLDIPPERVIKGALGAKLSEVTICGFTADGDEYFASSQADGGDVLWHLERAKHRLMTNTDERE